VRRAASCGVQLQGARMLSFLYGSPHVPGGRESRRVRATTRAAPTMVLTVPYQLRARLGFDGKLLGAVTRIFVDSVLGWYRRRLRASACELAEGGAVVVVQRPPGNNRVPEGRHTFQCVRRTARSSGLIVNGRQRAGAGSERKR
jgi:hypothetical protein